MDICEVRSMVTSNVNDLKRVEKTRICLRPSSQMEVHTISNIVPIAVKESIYFH